MKKLFTLLLAAMAAAGAQAQTTEYGFVVDQWPWNYAVSAQSSYYTKGEVNISFDEQYSEYKLIGKKYDLSKYKGYKVTYADASDIQLKIEYSDGTNNYRDLDATATTYSDDFTAKEGTVNTLNVQAKVAKRSVTIKELVLIDTDGNEEVVPYGGKAWGCEATGGTPYIIPEPTPLVVTFTGQYGGLKLADMDGNLATHAADRAPETYTITFNEGLGGSLNVELDDADGKGFGWFGIEPGTETFNFTVDPSKYDGKAVASIYVKANAENDAKDDAGNGKYSEPYAVTFKSITSAPATFKTTINATSNIASFSNAYNVTVPEDVAIYIATEVSDGGVTLTKVNDTVIPAGEGVILYSLNAGEREFTYGGKPAADYSANKLIGTGSAAKTATGSEYAVIAGEQNMGLVAAGVDIPANKAYLSGLGSAKLALSFGETTAIKSVDASTADNDATFNLAGQRVAKGYKGIVVKGGKKYIVK